MRPQAKIVLKELKDHPRTGYTARQALLDHNIHSLKSRVFELRRLGYNIESVKIKDGGKRFTRYYLRQKQKKTLRGFAEVRKDFVYEICKVLGVIKVVEWLSNQINKRGMWTVLVIILAIVILVVLLVNKAMAYSMEMQELSNLGVFNNYP